MRVSGMSSTVPTSAPPQVPANNYLPSHPSSSSSSNKPEGRYVSCSVILGCLLRLLCSCACSDDGGMSCVRWSPWV